MSQQAVPTNQFKVYCGDGAVIPKKGTMNSAGYDISSSIDIVVKPGIVNVISTGLFVAMPTGTYGRIAPRSGLAFKFGANILAGVIDADYRGEIKVLMTTLTEFPVKKGDRIAQLILEKYLSHAVLVEVGVITNLDITERGAGGFGSTGV